MNEYKKILENVYDELCMTLGEYEAEPDEETLYNGLCIIVERLAEYVN